MKVRVFSVIAFLLVIMLLSGCSGPKKKDNGSQQAADKKDNVVYLVQTAPTNMLEQLKAGEIDGFVAWEPFCTVAAKAGQCKYLFKSPDVWQNHPCCVVAVSGNFQDKQAVEAFVWAHIKATRFINDPANRDKVIKYASEFTGKSPDVAEKALANITYVEYPAKEEFQDYYNSLEQGGLIKRSVSDLGYQDRDSFFAAFLQESVYKDVADRLDRNSDWVPEPVADNTRLRVGYLNYDLHQLAMYVAEKEGYYAKVGLLPGRNLETRVFPNGVAVMEAFKAKDIDMAYLGGAPATLKRINDNIPVEVVAGANNEGSGLIVRNDTAINSVADLKGKTIAVPGLGTVQFTLLDKALKNNGLRPIIK